VSWLPKNWIVTELSNVAAWGSGGTPSRANSSYYGGNIPWIKTGELGQRYVFDTEEKITEAGVMNSSAKIFRKGSVAVAMYGATIGKTSILGIDATTNQACGVGMPFDGVTSSEYLYYYLSSQKEDFIEAGKGGAQPNISQTVIKSWPIPLAPLTEQKRIVDKLDTVLARVDACRERLNRVPLILKRFKQSVLAAATSGKLTEDWRELNSSCPSGEALIQRDEINKKRYLSNNLNLINKKSTLNSEIDLDYIYQIPENWAFTTWGKISEWITYGFTRPMPSSAVGKKLVTAKDVLNFNLRIDNAGYTTVSAYDELSDKDRPIRGDLLITKDGTIGRVALIRTEEPFCINQSVAVCWLRSTEMNKEFLEFVANAEFTQTFIKEKIKGVAIQHLSIIDFAQCPVPVPSIDEQNEIVRRVETLFAFADRLEARLTTAHNATERLTPALLAKAFRGELVPQDPNDEPAFELLARIKTQQEVGKFVSKSKATKKLKKTMKTEKIIPVLEALKLTNKRLSASELFQQSGYPQDASIQLVEQFFLDIKLQLAKKKIVKDRPVGSNEDFFTLADNGSLDKK